MSKGLAARRHAHPRARHLLTGASLTHAHFARLRCRSLESLRSSSPSGIAMPPRTSSSGQVRRGATPSSPAHVTLTHRSRAPKWPPAGRSRAARARGRPAPTRTSGRAGCAVAAARAQRASKPLSAQNVRARRAAGHHWRAARHMCRGMLRQPPRARQRAARRLPAARRRPTVPLCTGGHAATGLCERSWRARAGGRRGSTCTCTCHVSVQVSVMHVHVPVRSMIMPCHSSSS